MTPPSAIAIRRGDRGSAVAAVRERLVIIGELDAGGSDDIAPEVGAEFDDRVERAVKSFQQRRGLLVDGVVGSATYAALDGARYALGDRVLRHQPGHFLEGDDVATLQGRLVELGFRPGKVDGIHGPLTDEAVRAFQADVGLVSDGTVGPETMRAFEALRRSVRGGSANALREREHIRRSGHSLSGRTIVIDPGHGGDDHGAQGLRGLVEADLALELARRIEGRLSAHGVNVVFTRTNATTAGTDDDRADFANGIEADLVLSLHSDHSPSGSAHGVATYFYGHDAGPAGTEASGTAGSRAPGAHGARSLIGERFADLLLREVVARTGLTDCRTHARTWTLLRRTTMPAVQLDVGYLDHEGDAGLLSRPETLDRVAEAAVVALQRLYLGENDTAQTGVLHLGDLRRHLEALRSGSSGAEVGATG